MKSAVSRCNGRFRVRTPPSRREVQKTADSCDNQGLLERFEYCDLPHVAGFPADVVEQRERKAANLLTDTAPASVTLTPESRSTIRSIAFLNETTGILRRCQVQRGSRERARRRRRD